MTGQLHANGTAWSPVTPVTMQPNSVEGWQIVKLTLIPGGSPSGYQVYTLYVDPYVRANRVSAGIVDKARGGGMQEGTSSPLLFRPRGG